MKLLKTGLLIFLIINIYSSLVVNLQGYSSFAGKDYQKNLNVFGKMVVRNDTIIDKASIFYNDGFRFLGTFSGTNRGYSFFSPNVSNSKLDISFVSEDGILEFPLDSPESMQKFKTSIHYFTTNFKNKKLRNLILSSYAQWHFAQNPNLNKIKVYFDIYEVNTLSNIEKGLPRDRSKNFLGFILEKNLK